SRIPQMRISGVRHLSVSRDLHPQCAFRCDSKLVFRGLTVDQKAIARWILIGRLGAKAVAFLAHQEQHADGYALLAKTLAGGDLGGDDSFRVACTPTIDVLAVFRRGDEGRNGIHVSGEDQVGRLVLKSGLYTVSSIS